MIAIMGSIINGIWELLSVPFQVDGITFNTWQVILFVAITALFINGLFGKAGDK